MYMSVEDQYFWEFILVISIGITFAFWYIKNRIDYKMRKQYQVVDKTQADKFGVDMTKDGIHVET